MSCKIRLDSNKYQEYLILGLLGWGRSGFLGITSLLRLRFRRRGRPIFVTSLCLSSYATEEEEVFCFSGPLASWALVAVGGGGFFAPRGCCFYSGGGSGLSLLLDQASSEQEEDDRPRCARRVACQEEARSFNILAAIRCDFFLVQSSVWKSGLSYERGLQANYPSGQKQQMPVTSEREQR